jgi:sortase A
MRNEKKSVLWRICVAAGICMLVAAVGVLILWQWSIRTSETRSASYVQTLRALIPEPQGAVPEPRRDNTMPVLSLEGTDFVGILEIPRYGSALPVGAEWGKPGKYPCRLSGSVYDSTLQIGGTSQRGQYDFYREISVGDSLFFTDMEGNRYGYTVTDLRYEKHADQTALQRKESAMTLFVKNIYAFEYVVIFCDVMN